MNSDRVIDFLNFINQSDEDKYNMILHLVSEINKLENYNYNLECTLRCILHFCNHLHNDCKYNLNDGHIRKIRNICRKELKNIDNRK